MKTHRIGVIMNGVTGRMGTNQHLLRSIAAIIKQGGIKVGDGEVIMPAPVLVGRSAIQVGKTGGAVRRRRDLHHQSGRSPRRPQQPDYFDAQLTQLRAPAVSKAIDAGKHIYCEKPTGVSTEEAYELYQKAKAAGVKHGVVQDKLFLPGLLKLKNLIDTGFFGEILSVRGEFGYWVFTGHDAIPVQRPSWNYRKEDGGGIIVDMLCHWRYVLDNLFGNVNAVSCLGATHIKGRIGEDGKPYVCTADDAAYATFELDSGVIAQFNSSWTVRVRRDDLLTLQVDGTKGTAVAGLRNCKIQPYGGTPRPVWNPDIDQPIDFYADWMTVPTNQLFDNGFKLQWESFLRHVVLDEPWRFGLLEGAKGVQLAEAGLQSWADRCWVTWNRWQSKMAQQEVRASQQTSCAADTKAMPLDALVVAQVPYLVDAAALEAAGAALLTESDFEEDDFLGAPLIFIEDEIDSPFILTDEGKEIEVVRAHPADTWIRFNSHSPYYGPGYERGDLPGFVSAAEWLENRFPGSRLWYGGDCTSILFPFGSAERDERMHYYREVGHEPYRNPDYRRTRAANAEGDG